jgi:hypothetical protein
MEHQTTKIGILFEEWAEHIEYFPTKEVAAYSQSFNGIVASKTRTKGFKITLVHTLMIMHITAKIEFPYVRIASNPSSSPLPISVWCEVIIRLRVATNGQLPKLRIIVLNLTPRFIQSFSDVRIEFHFSRCVIRVNE